MENYAAKFNFESLINQSVRHTGEVCHDTMVTILGASNPSFSEEKLNVISDALHTYIEENDIYA